MRDRNRHYRPSLVDHFATTWPRLEIYILVLSYQTIAQTCTFTVLSDGRGTGVRLFAAAIFLLWPVGFLYFAATFIRIRVLKQRRACPVVDRNRTGGFLRWVDWPPPVGEHVMAKHRHKTYTSGFVAQHGTYLPFSDFFLLLCDR